MDKKTKVRLEMKNFFMERHALMLKEVSKFAKHYVSYLLFFKNFML